MRDELFRIADDGLYTPEIKLHSLEKIRLHNRYASIFASAMKDTWAQLAYIGLYAGAGHARLKGTDTIVETSAVSVLHQAVPFTDYIFVDRDQRCIDALSARCGRVSIDGKVTFIQNDVNSSIPEVRHALPQYSKTKGLLSFCFVDPFDLQLRFSTIRQLSHLRMDFLVLLMLGVDGRRNFHRYLSDPSDGRIGDLIDRPSWRSEYEQGRSVIHFLLHRFDKAMQSLGYLSAAQDAHFVKIAGMGVLQYVLAFYSKDPMGQHFWRETRGGLSQQLLLL
jgi:three-Cys-motif partner protein